MSDKDNDKQALETLATDNSLETVRDILFGAQVKQANERDQQLEKLINTRADTLQKSLDTQIKAVEASIQKLSDKLAKDAEATAAKVEQRFKQVEDAIKSLESATQAQQQEMYDELAVKRYEERLLNLGIPEREMIYRFVEHERKSRFKKRNAELRRQQYEKEDRTNLVNELKVLRADDPQMYHHQLRIHSQRYPDLQQEVEND